MKKNKIVNKIGILVLAVMLSILSSITVLASEPEEAELNCNTLSVYDIIFNVVAPNLATERGCTRGNYYILFGFRYGRRNQLLHLQMVRRKRQ